MEITGELLSIWGTGVLLLALIGWLPMRIRREFEESRREFEEARREFREIRRELQEMRSDIGNLDQRLVKAEEALGLVAHEERRAA